MQYRTVIRSRCYAAQPSKERFAFLGVQGRAAPAEGDKGGRVAHRRSCKAQ